MRRPRRVCRWGTAAKEERAQGGPCGHALNFRA